MRPGALSLLLFLAVPISGGLGRSEAPQGPRVTVDSGILVGTHFGSLPGEVAFLGVPFAAPPVGDLRWKPPQPLQKWRGIRDASQFAASCPQLPSSWWPEMAGLETLDTSEDCLYLNIWTTNFSKTAKQAVMLWIHGGSNVEGSSHIPPIGPALARKGVVVVSLDYRLGVLGYLAHPALRQGSVQNSSGNYGLLDQIAGLRWVRENIAAFGGDSEAITIFGESSGAEDVCHLLASPLARGLFHRAILESGVCLDSLYSAMSKAQNYYGNHGSGEPLGLRLADQVGIPNDESAPSALRALSTERLVDAAQKVDSEFGVIIDDWVVPAQPALTFASAIRHKFSVCAVISDLDNFKNLNDTFGHAAGDTALQSFAEILKKNCRTSNLCGRVGGEEFLMVLTHSEVEGATVAVEHIQQDPAQQRFSFGTHNVVVTASFGIACIDRETHNLANFVLRADQALYSAKRSGRNRISVAPAAFPL